MQDRSEIKKDLSSMKIDEIFSNASIGILLLNSEMFPIYVNETIREFGVLTKHFDPENKVSGVKLFEGVDFSEEIDGLRNGDYFERIISSSFVNNERELRIIVKGSPIVTEGKFEGALLIVEDFNVVFEAEKDRLLKTDFFGSLTEGLADYFALYSPQQKILFEAGKMPEGVNRDYHFTSADKQFELAFSRVEKELSKSSYVVSIEATATENVECEVSLIPIKKKDKLEAVALLLEIVKQKDGTEIANSAKVVALEKEIMINSLFIDAIIGVDKKGKIVIWNDTAEELFGKRKEEILGENISAEIKSFTVDFLNSLFSGISEDGTWEAEIKVDQTDANSELLEVKAKLLKEEEVLLFLCSSITERADLEKDLRQSEERFRNIVTNTREYICTFDLTGNITYTNPYFSKIFNYTPQELLGLNFLDILVQDHINLTRVELEYLFNNQKDPIELTLRKKHGSKVYVLANFTPVNDYNGKPKYFSAVFTDITEKKKAEKDLRMIRSVFETSQDGIAVMNKRKYILTNDSFADMFGYSSVTEVLGKDPLDFVANDDLKRIADYISAIENEDEIPDRYIFKGKKKDGTEFSVEKSVSSFQAEGSVIAVASFRDITLQEKALTALEMSEERYRSITENIDDSMWTAELKRNKLVQTFYTGAIRKITGYKKEQFLDDQRLWLRIIHPNDTRNVVKKLNRIYKDPVRTGDSLIYRIIANNGNIVWIKNKINVIRDDDGRIVKIFGLVSDISLSKKGEEELQKSTDDLKNLNDAKDKFISIISHDLRTPFSSILGFTDLLLSDRNMSEEKQVEYISFIQESSKNMLSLVNSLLDWTRLQTGRINFEPERINAKTVITNGIQMLSGSAMQKNINLVSDLSGDVYVHADENLLLQVFNNLISNAIKFTPQGGCITVAAKPVVRKRQVEFMVKDSGMGIKKKDLDKLFRVETKFTSPGTAGEKGSGLGLSLCKDIVNKHGGEIGVRSEYGMGTEFYFTIPVSSTKILLVDGSSTDRLLYNKLIKTLVPNYEVVESNNGEEAFKIIKDSSPALVITDHKMPKVSGYELVKNLRISDIKQKPPVIVLSSDLTASIIDEYKELGIDYAFKKPVNLTMFKFAIDKSLKKAIIN